MDPTPTINIYSIIYKRGNSCVKSLRERILMVANLD